MSYYLGYNNGGEDFYSKKALLDRINSDRTLIDFISSGGYVTIIKENSKSRVFMNPVITDGKVNITTDYKENQDEFGDYGN